MRKKYRNLIILVFTIILIFSNTVCFASTDEFAVFSSVDASADSIMMSATAYGMLTFQKLGYINVNGTNMGVTNATREQVLNYISGTGKNYGFLVSAHGYAGRFNMNMSKTDGSQRVYASDITGYWHLVFINACDTMSTDEMARAFKTIGYTNRASMGWSGTISNEASKEWWGHFYNSAGNMSLRAAALDAASKCINSTPIRAYGDKESWYGYAW